MTGINFEQKLKELETINKEATLEKDPLAIGLDYFTEKFYMIQSSRDKILSYLVEAIWHKTLLNSKLSQLQSEYEQKLSGILIREDVKCLKSNELRMAVANTELADLVRQIKDLENQLLVVEAYYKTVTVYYEEMKSKNDNLAQQFLTIRAILNIDPSLKDAVIKVSSK